MRDRNGKRAVPAKVSTRQRERDIAEAAELIERLTTENQTYEQQLELGGRFMTVLVEREIERSGRCVITRAELERAPTLWDGVRHEAPPGEERVVLHLVPLPKPGEEAQPEVGAQQVAETKEERLH